MDARQQIAELQHEVRVRRWVMDHQPTMSPWRRDAMLRENAKDAMTIERLKAAPVEGE